MQTAVNDLYAIVIVTAYNCMSLYFGSLDKQTIFISICCYINVAYLLLVIICVSIRLYMKYSILRVLTGLSLVHICEYHINIYCFIEVFLHKNYVIYTLNFRAVMGILQCAYLLILSFRLGVYYSQKKIDIYEHYTTYRNLGCRICNDRNPDENCNDGTIHRRDEIDVYRECRDQREPGDTDRECRDQKSTTSRSASNSTSVSISIEEICT